MIPPRFSFCSVEFWKNLEIFQFIFTSNKLISTQSTVPIIRKLVHSVVNTIMKVIQTVISNVNHDWMMMKIRQLKMRSVLVATLIVTFCSRFRAEEIFSAVQKLEKLFRDESEIIKESESLISDLIDILEDFRR